MLRKIGDRVFFPGHGNGTIVDFNTTKPITNEHLKEFAGKIPAALLMGGFYSGDRYPYVIQFDSGYKDVYSDHLLEDERKG